MSETIDPGSRQIAIEKMRSGGLMTLNEVATVLDVKPATVHKLPIPSIRLGRSLRFDSADVSHLIGSCKEPFVQFEKGPCHMNVVFFGMKYFDETNGALGCLANDNPIQRLEWSDVIEALCAGKTVTISPASPLAIAYAEELLEQIKTKQLEGN